MIKAANILLCSSFLLVAPRALQAQASPTDAAVKEAVRREANTIVLRQKLAAAQTAQAKNDLVNAAKLYEVCWTMIKDIGAGVETETDQVVYGITTVRMELAREASRHGDYKEANAQVNLVLRVNPKDEAALSFKKDNDKALAEQAGKVPGQDVIDQIPAIHTNKIHAATLVQDGRVLYELGKLDEAEAKLNQALKIDAGNFGANYYLNLIREKRYKIIAQDREKTSKDKLVEVEEAWNNPTQRESLPFPNPYARTNLIYTSKGRQAILSKLDRIVLNEVMYDGLPLGEVIKTLNIEARKRDPDKTGVNFIINPIPEASFTTIATPGGFGGFPGAAAPQIDPTTGLPVTGAAAPEPVDMSAIAIKINPAITDVRLADVLDAIIKVAEKPIKYSIEDYAVVFSTKTAEAAPLFTRFFRVDPNTFYQGLEAVSAISFGDIQTSSGGGQGGGGGGGGGGGQGGGGQGGQGGVGGAIIPRVFVAGQAQGGQGGGQGGGGGGGGSQGGGSALLPAGTGAGGVGGVGGAGGGAGGAQGQGGGITFITRQALVDQVQATVRAFFAACGVDLNPPKNLFFNDRQGMLMVRGTLQDLDIVESAVQTLNIAPPQVTIEAKFVEISQTDTKALGFDWWLGNTVFANGNLVASGGTQPTLVGPPPFPGNPAAGTGIAPALTDGRVTSGLRNATKSGEISIPTVATITGILSDPQFRVAIRALEQRSGVDLLNAPKVTTLSGRQAHMEVTDLLTIVTGTDANQTSGGGGGGGTVTVGGGGGNVGSTIQPQTQILPFGPVLDVIPYVSADGFSIQMTIIPTITEFLGYDEQNQFTVQAQSTGVGAGQALSAPVPLPRFRSRQVVTSANVWDGQTIVLGGLISEDVAKTKDKVPVLGDLPLIGRFFRSEASHTAKKNLVIFVTPTIIDPSGNRLHSEDEMPFAQSTIPPVPPEADPKKKK